MPLSRSSSTKEVGLRLLFCPLGSNIILRTACCSVGVALPVYSRQLRGKIKMSNTSGSCIGQLMEVLALLRFAMYYQLKFAFLVWLQLPSIDVNLKTTLIRSILLDSEPADQNVEGGVLNVDPNQPEGCNAIEDLDGITSDTDIESNLEVEETLITHLGSVEISGYMVRVRTVLLCSCREAWELATI
ncbi:hypothetical protein CUMW_260690 [Citrus unshiu]|uniref:HVA22-like protein n=1 Tax=Citrus unshiu TaxID=55188 RepID=A0A2H5QTP6_CITUN|nr:hypothetical protein CUMW_260690 [Citrus unshiu]